MSTSPEHFEFTLTDDEKTYLKQLVHDSIASQLDDNASAPKATAAPPTDRLREHLGAFVTLKINGHLRGCIGHIVGDAPLYTTIWNMARQAAFHDPRFPPLTASEFARTTTEISILSPLTPCPDTSLIEVGRHGLVMQNGPNSGLLLPQVPVEWNWDRETFLAHTCQKAGLPPTCHTDPQTTIYWFEAEVF